jgi:hypothetical protein
MNVLSMGQTISSGRRRATATSMSSGVATTATLTWWPSSVRATCARWLRLLCADTRNRIRSGLAVDGASETTARSGMESSLEAVLMRKTP